MLGTALSLWGNQPGIGLSPKRGALGFTVESRRHARPSRHARLALQDRRDGAKPICSDFTAYWRAGQKFYLDVVNGAINSLNADKLDSAEYYATQANKLYAASPYGDMVLGSVASKRGNTAQGARVLEQGRRSRGARTPPIATFAARCWPTSAASTWTPRNTATGAEKVAAARKAADIYAQLIAVPGSRGQYLSGGRQQLQTAYLLAGDTAAAAKTWEPLLANPTAYEYQDLLNSAVTAARANRTADAGKLFEATLAQNPNNRDALFNVAVTYLTLEQNEKVGPIVTRLVAVDPGNPENYNLAARAYLSLGQGGREGEEDRRSPPRTTTRRSPGTTTGNKLPVEVTFSEFSPGRQAGRDRRARCSIAATRSKPNNPRRPRARRKAGEGQASSGAEGRRRRPSAETRHPQLRRARQGGRCGRHGDRHDRATDARASRRKFKVTIAAPNVVAYRYTIVD